MPHPVSRTFRLLVTGTCAAGLLSFSAVRPAYAVGEPFDPRTCQNFQQNAPIPAWQTDRLKPQRAWSLATGKGVRIALIDTGVDTDQNPALQRQGRPAITESYDFAGYTRVRADNNQRRSDCQHGTLVASLILGRTQTTGPNPPATNFAGLAPDATLISMRALEAGEAGPERSGQPEPLDPTIRALRKAVELRVNIINISQQGSDTVEYRQAIRDAVTSGILVVAAAGNHGGEDAPLPYPAAYPGVLAVGMSDINDGADPRSQSHPDLEVSVAAPGTDVLMANPSDKGEQSWQVESGTSFAAPQVSALAALVWERYPQASATEIKRRIEASADPPAGAVPDRQLGHGIINPYRALTDPPAANRQASVRPIVGAAPDPRERPDHDLPGRILAFGFGAGALILVGLAAALAAAYPSGRKRRWHHAE